MTLIARPRIGITIAYTVMHRIVLGAMNTFQNIITQIVNIQQVQENLKNNLIFSNKHFSKYTLNFISFRSDEALNVGKRGIKKNRFNTKNSKLSIKDFVSAEL